VEVTPKGLQEINGGCQAAKTVSAGEPPEQAEETNGLVALHCGLGYPFGDRLDDTLEPLRVDTSESALQQEKIPNSPNGFGCFGIVHYLLQKFVAGGQAGAHNLQHTASVQLLEYFVRGQYSFGMFFGCLLQTRAQRRTRVAGRDF
jgi:hypothetical protein